MTLRETGLHTVDYSWTKKDLTKHIHHLLDSGQDVPDEFLRRVDELNNDTHTPKVRAFLAGQDALVTKSRPSPPPAKPRGLAPPTQAQAEEALRRNAREAVGYVDLPSHMPPAKAPPSEPPHIKAMRAIATQSKLEAQGGPKQENKKKAYEHFIKTHTNALGGNRDFVNAVYKVAQEHGIQEVADEKLRSLNISTLNRININDPAHDGRSRETLRIHAQWTDADFNAMLVARSLQPGNAYTDWEHFRKGCGHHKVKRRLLMDCMRVFFENPRQAYQDHIWNAARLAQPKAVPKPALKAIPAVNIPVAKNAAARGAAAAQTMDHRHQLSIDQYARIEAERLARAESDQVDA